MKRSLSHTVWECKYHIVWVPKKRRKIIYGKLREELRTILKRLCQYKGVEVVEGTMCMDHIHMCLMVPPKFSIAFVIGFIKGKSPVLIHRTILKNKKVSGLHFWARGYCVSTVGLDEQTILKYIREQEQHEKQQLELEFE